MEKKNSRILNKYDTQLSSTTKNPGRPYEIKVVYDDINLSMIKKNIFTTSRFTVHTQQECKLSGIFKTIEIINQQFIIYLLFF